MTDYQTEDHGDKGRTRHGSSTFYKLLQEMAETHDKKSHDYASNQNPSGNYHFAGMVASLFSHSHQDAGFASRIAEKIYRLSNLESSGKIPNNEGVEDTERDIAVIVALWMADRRDRRKTEPVKYMEELEVAVIKAEAKMDDLTVDRCISYLNAAKEARSRKS